MQNGPRQTNRLSEETSPYLLQHSHNPVDWYPWGEEALELARSQDKPILVSIGYSACHWCHVMERESFEDEETARLMNEHFVNIKVDREERPDIDHIYMDAVQAMTGAGGWPLNVFLTPDARPFYGGTYFPPRPLYNRGSWKDVLAGVAGAFRDRRAEVEQHAETLTHHVAASGNFGIGDGASAAAADNLFQRSTLRQIKEQLMAAADKQAGGFGQAPKFPQTLSIRYLLYDYSVTGDEAALDQACLSLDSMIRGGIYDQLGGGFARYSTDDRWLVPHFEKMLYDNALLIIALSEAYQLLCRIPATAERGVLRAQLYRDTIVQTVGFLERELSNGESAFFAALDADSEGVEGKYYVWDKDEIDALLGDEAGLFNEYYGVTGAGNWEGKNILTRPSAAPALPGQRGKLDSAARRLLEHRAQRIPPGLDDKILLGWNALMNIALSKAFAALGVDRYRDMAIANMQFLRQHLRRRDGASGDWFHARKGVTEVPAFLDDYAPLIAAMIQLQEITGDPAWLREADETLRHVIDHFGDPETGFFFYTHSGQQDILLRKKEIYDGATPSGNSMMASNLLYLSIVFDQPEWARRARQMASALGRVVTTYPGSFGGWATLFQALTYSIAEVVLTGRKPEIARKEFLAYLVPFRVFQSAQDENTQFPLLRDKPVEAGPLIFLCKDYACQLPVNEVSTAIRLIENVQKFQK